ncbi:NAD(P)/FAD-dependent oxidoreductase [Geodermatophilus obscurus]|uniref:NADH:ubiquinone reductase (non-electrogenic) n=1 Tax=Geodermatophilus obscurus (strain ATCC 25078 / DSM 43160 / JCM 3152 / CCUG 61914 / KCC A-0152 / KCTC 9177 / NBRC 13315 / NRRL B-3577 / G-20) TaxID=526225 RepID=D2SD78_GEOOG|nr:NAD(P)/FAD-dependent oxidoreductase [Geodermatophilus obscurus]ADB76427.1 FAD-dependent pyridine nucleotide-disulphide oxidoreductase [Geodermatophilus obscurus DSM 43160]
MTTSPVAGPVGASPSGRPRVVIVGSGFGGLFAAKALKRAPVDVTVIGKTSHHLFQPLLYQVATGILSEGEIAPATREILRHQKNARVALGEVTDVDLAARTVTSTILGRTTVHPYDELIVAAGAGQSYFGNDRFAVFAPGMKSIDDALELRGRIFGAFELAELATDPAERDRLLTFVVVGAGPTGVEMAGQIAELAHRTLRRDFRSIDPTQARVILLDAAPQVLPPFGEKLGERARRHLNEIGVEVQLGAMVTDLDADGLEVKDRDGQVRRIQAATKVWAAGVQASPLGRLLAEQSGAEIDRAGRINVLPDLTLPGHPEVHVVGDMMALDKLPGVAQVAIQGGRYAADQITRRIAGREARGPFHYRDKGNMATISRFSAVADIKNLKFEGFFAWVLWLVVHLMYIVGFKSRVTAVLHWMVSFLGRSRAERVATQQQVYGRLALEELGPGFAVGKTGGRKDPQAPPTDITERRSA